MKYVALLRGINVGGKALVKMDELKRAFEEIGAQDVTTLLNSGNVCFQMGKDQAAVRTSIEEKLKQQFARDICVLVRSSDQIAQLISSQPFDTIATLSDTRLYVTFLEEKPDAKDIAAVPITPNFHITKVTGSEICIALTLTNDSQTTDLMAEIEKVFGSRLTTRNWNTVLKIAQRLSL